MAVVLWTGPIGQLTYRVVDEGAGTSPRLIVEQQATPDAMGGRGWARVDTISRETFEAILIASGVVK